MIKHKEKNKYSLNAESYGISKKAWRIMKEEVIQYSYTSEQMRQNFRLDSKQIWFLYDILLQEKYNHLYKRDKLVEPKVGDYVYCDYEGFGRGTIESFSLDGSIMAVKFDKRLLTTFCDVSSMSTNFDEVKRKITRL